MFASAIPSCVRLNFVRISNTRLASSFHGLSNVAITDDQSTLVVWHPKQDFPYECTKPLPVTEPVEDHSVLKTQLTPKVLQVFKKKSPEQARQELMNITNTTQHRWFPRNRDRKAKKTEMNREYL